MVKLHLLEPGKGASLPIPYYVPPPANDEEARQLVLNTRAILDHHASQPHNASTPAARKEFLAQHLRYSKKVVDALEEYHATAKTPMSTRLVTLLREKMK